MVNSQASPATVGVGAGVGVGFADTEDDEGATVPVSVPDEQTIGHSCSEC